MALPMTLIIITGEIDLSVASILGMSSALLGDLVSRGWSMPLVLVIVLVVGAIAGAFNGFLVTRVGLPSLAVTIGTLTLYRGIAIVILGPPTISTFPTRYTNIGVNAVPAHRRLHLVLRPVLRDPRDRLRRRPARDPVGRSLFVMGANEEAARYAGIRVKRTKLILFAVSGLVCAFAGILYTFRLSTAVQDNGLGLELSVVTIVLLGGVSIFGGRGTIIGVVLAIGVFAGLQSALLLTNFNQQALGVVTGSLLLLSVLIPNVSLRTSRARHLPEAATATWRRRVAREGARGVSDVVHVAFDLGAESGRAMLGRFDGERIELEEVRRFPTQSVRLPDGLYWNALGLFCELTAAPRPGQRIRRVHAQRGHRLVGRRLRPARRDRCAARQPVVATATGAARRSCARRWRGDRPTSCTRRRASSSCRSTRSTSCSRCRAERRARASGDAPAHPGPARLLADRRTGAPRRRTPARRSSLERPPGEWASDLIERLGLPTRIFPPIVQPGSILGGLLPHVVGRRGFRQGRPIVARGLARHRLRGRRSAARRPFRRRSSRAGRGRSSASSSERRCSRPSRAERQPHERAGLRRRHPASQERHGSVARAGVPPRVAARRRRAGVPGARRARPHGVRAAPSSTPTFPSCWLRATCRRASGPPARAPVRTLPGDAPALMRAIFDSLACKYRLVLEQIEDVTGSDDRLRARDRRRLAEPLPLPADRERDASRRTGRAGRGGGARERPRAAARVRRRRIARGDACMSSPARPTSAPSSPIPRPRRGTTLYARFQTVLDAEVRTR